MSKLLILIGGLLGVIAITAYYIYAYYGYSANDIYRCGDFLSLTFIFTGIGWGCKNIGMKFLVFYNIASFWGLLFLLYFLKFITDEDMDIHLLYWLILTSTILCLLSFILVKRLR